MGEDPRRTLAEEFLAVLRMLPMDPVVAISLLRQDGFPALARLFEERQEARGDVMRQGVVKRLERLEAIEAAPPSVPSEPSEGSSDADDLQALAATLARQEMELRLAEMELRRAGIALQLLEVQLRSGEVRCALYEQEKDFRSRW